ncbi:hypothetical protein H0Z09_11785 [Pseudomonas sp. SWRI18]|uniref:hypothetical protein n=1 Tax=Pseudomonas sp. SWRI18 TaxID=2753888 RepID=UPI0016460BBC|nr:hypothetical protein [Pseudomonas sp. SWRI18]MBC3301808.1 hypothetical protein [Pseudomonas sp. SWRI18]
MAQNNDEKASKGWFKSTGFEGDVDTTAVDYRQSPTGSRGITIYGLQPTANGNSIGVQINFPNDAPLGPIPVPKPFPDDVIVAYFRQASSGQRTSYRAKNGVLELLTFDAQRGFVSGKFNVLADVDGTERSFEGSFDIHSV